MSPATLFLISSLLLSLLDHTTSYSSSGPHIADGNILLPPKMTHPVDYRIQVTGGCFKWSWDHHDLLSVLPEYNSSRHCSTSARLKSIAPYSGRKETAVYATDLNTRTVVRYKVYIDTISRIQIFHSSIRIDLDEFAPLRVRAFDSKDNVFSSLVGLQFMWQLIPETHGLPHNLVHVPLKDSQLSDFGGLFDDLDIKVNLEESGVFSDVCVVKGTGIGHAIVSVRLLESSVQNLVDEITLTVVEAMSIDPPSPVYVLIGSVVRYTLKAIHSNRPRVVSLPSQFHQWSALNSSVAEVDREMGTAHALDLGVTLVVVVDTRVVGHMQISSLHVVLPDNLLLFLTPLFLSGDYIDGDVKPISSVSRWYVVAGQQYLIHFKVFSQVPGTQEIFLTENDVVELSGNQDELWDIFPGFPTKSNYRVLTANSYGLRKLTATLTYSTGRDTRKEALKVVQEVMVCDQVEFVMEREGYVFSKILLPWVPGVYQEVEVKARGGCAMSSGDYKWVSFDMAVVSVSVSGIALAKKPGKATIRAVSIFDPLNYDEMVIEVSIPFSMAILPNFPVETPAGSHLQASVTLRASGGTYFHACDAFRSFIRWKTESDSFIIVNATEAIELNSSSYGPPCAWTRIYASESGRTVLHATLNRENQQSDHNDRGSNDVLKVSSRIAAYSPLIVHQASDGNHFGGYWFDMASIESQNELRNLDHVFLAPGTYLDVMLHGGPERWGSDVEFIENVHVWDEWKPYVKNKIFIHQMSTSYGNNTYRIGCKGMGSFLLYFRRGNLVGEDHHLPVVSEAEIILSCTIPSYILIIAEEAYAPPITLSAFRRAERWPGGIRAAPVTVSNGRKIRISAVGLSNMGTVFANSSSLVLRWGLSECEGLAVFEDSHSSKAYSSWERFLILQNTSGQCIVRSDGVGFIDSLSHYDIPVLRERFTNDLTDAIQLQLVSSLRVSPDFSLLFFSPLARLNISITGGSCFFDALVNDTEILEVTQPMRGHECSQLTLAPKGPGPALVTIHDIGLVPPLSASVIVQVAEMGWIKILTGERIISIVEGSFQSINFLVGVEGGHVFDPSQYIYMGIHVHIEENIVEVVEKYVWGPNFTLQATRLGVTTICLSAIKASGHKILSQLVMLEVYAPPRLHPTDIFLVPGSSYVLTVRGGPKIGSRVQYSSMDDHTAEVHEYSGRLSAISPGNSTVIATIYGDGDIMLCQAYGKVKVGIPSSAVLNVQSEEIAIDSMMPIYPSLSEGNLFSFYELCNNFKWTAEDKRLLNFQVENKEHGTGQDLNFIRVLQGISSGKTNVTVSFSCHYNLASSVSKSMSYTASISLWVVPNLPLALGSQATWILPSYYTSSHLLPHSLSDEGIDYSLVHWKRKTEEVQDDDIYIDGTKIVTKESGNLACIQAKDTSTGRSEVASCVRVAEVAQIRIMTDEFPIHEMAVGAELDLPIKYHDTLGNPFHEAHNITPLIEVETNYPDVVSIEEYNGNNIHLQAKSQGLALVQIAFVSDPRKSIYAIISVGPDQLYPPSNLVTHTPGSDLNFSKNRLSDSTSGQRFSGNLSIVFVERPSGKAEGTTNVHFESLSSGFELQTTVTVLKENPVFVDAPNEILTSVPFPAKGYAFSINLSDPFSISISFDPHLAFGLPSRARIQILELNTESIC